MNYKKLTVFALMAFALAIGLSYGNRKASAASTLIVDDDLACTGATFTTIQAAVNVANPGDTIMVCPGTYNELVTVDRTLTILGAQSGVDARTRAVPVTSESVVGSGDGAFQIEADNVVIDGFTIQGVTNNPSAPPLQVWAQASGAIPASSQRTKAAIKSVTTSSRTTSWEFSSTMMGRSP